MPRFYIGGGRGGEGGRAGANGRRPDDGWKRAGGAPGRSRLCEGSAAVDKLGAREVAERAEAEELEEPGSGVVGRLLAIVAPFEGDEFAAEELAENRRGTLNAGGFDIGAGDRLSIGDESQDFEGVLRELHLAGPDAVNAGADLFKLGPQIELIAPAGEADFVGAGLPHIFVVELGDPVVDLFGGDAAAEEVGELADSEGPSADEEEDLDDLPGRDAGSSVGGVSGGLDVIGYVVRRGRGLDVGRGKIGDRGGVVREWAARAR